MREELRRLHTSYRLALSDRIETAIHGVGDHFPGFRQGSLFGEVGWGSACYRDDLRIESGRRSNQYSRLEMVIRPYSDLRVLDLKGKGTVMNRELFNRSYYVPIAEVDVEEFEQLIDTWAIEYGGDVRGKKLGWALPAGAAVRLGRRSRQDLPRKWEPAMTSPWIESAYRFSSALRGGEPATGNRSVSMPAVRVRPILWSGCGRGGLDHQRPA